MVQQSVLSAPSQQQSSTFDDAVNAYDYPLAPELIAQRPLRERDGSRMLEVAADGTFQDRTFRELPTRLRQGDLIVVNETRVRAARLYGTYAGDAHMEALVLESIGDD